MLITKDPTKSISDDMGFNLVCYMMVPRLIQQFGDGIRSRVLSMFLLHYPQGICLLLGLVFLYSGEDGSWSCKTAK